MRLRALAKELAEHLLLALPNRTPARGRLVLSYHNVVPDELTGFGDSSLHLAQSAFDAQLKLLSSVGDIVSLDTLLLESNPSSRLISITFDDAYVGALRSGVSLCESRRVPCTVFVSPALLGTVTPWDAYSAIDCWSASARHAYLEEGGGLRNDSETDAGSAKLADSGAIAHLRIATHDELERCVHLSAEVRVANHTYNHRNLAAVAPQTAWQEIREAADWLTARFPGKVQQVVAYPYGCPPSPEIAARLRADGIYGLLNAGGWQLPGSDCEAGFPRWNVPAELSNNGFKLRLLRTVS